MYAEVVRCLKVLGFTFREETRPDVRQVIIAQRHEVLRFLGSIRPRRMLAQFEFEWLCQFNALERVPVKEVRYVGERPVAVLAASTGTYIAEGLAVHDSPTRPSSTCSARTPNGCMTCRAADQAGTRPDGLLDTPITDADGVAKWTDRCSTPGSRCSKASTSASCRWVRRERRLLPQQRRRRILPTPATGAALLRARGPEARRSPLPTPIVDIQLSSATISSSG